MASLVESGMKNLNFGDADSVGFFQMRVGIWNKGEYAGYPEDPKLQVKWFLDTAEQVKKQRIAAGKSIDDPSQFGEWIADVERPAEQYRYRYQEKLSEAQGLLANQPAAAPVAPVAAVPGVVDPAAVVSGGGGGSPIGAAALGVARSQLGVHEVGTNRGPQVDQYLAAAKTAPGNPWCASFVTWSLEKAGRKMDGGGWAGVATWVRNAEQGNNGLKFVSAEDARPGDIVAYDWGGQNDFGADGHIGFLDSTVKDGKFTALEGNNNDEVGVVPRQMGGAKVVFIRVDGDAPAGSVPAVAAGRQPPAGVPAEAAPARRPIDPAQFGGEGTGTGGPPDAEALALLQNKNVVLDATGIADIKAGRIDPRVVGVLTKLSQEHKITVSCMCSDHSKFTAGGSVSNHFFGRGMDIAAIDGEIVGPGSPLAREVASELSDAGPEHPPERDRLPVRDQRPRLLHRRRPPEPPAHRLQGGDHARLDAARRRRRRARGAGRRRRRRAGHPGGRGRRRAGRSRRRRAGGAEGLAGVPEGGHRRGRGGRPQALEGQRLAGVPEGRRAAQGQRRRGRPGGRARSSPAPPWPRSTPPPSPRARPTPTPATTRRASRSPPGWPARRRSAGCRRNSR